MMLRLLVIVYANEKDVAGVFGNLRRILLSLDLIERSVDGMVEF